MYCAKCGNLLLEDAKFCPNCGKAVEFLDTKASKPSKGAENSVNEAAEDSLEVHKKTKSSRLPMAVVFLSVIILAVIGVIIYVSSTRKITIDITPYIEIDYAGYSPIASAMVKINEDGLANEIAGKIKKSYSITDWDNVLPTDFKREDDYNRVKSVMNSIGFSPDNVEDVSNGDTLHFSFRFKEDILENYKVRIMYNGEEAHTGAKLRPVEVTGIEEAYIIDLAEIINLDISGYNGYATCSLAVDEAALAIDIAAALGMDYNLSDWDSLAQIYQAAGDYKTIDGLINSVDIYPEEYTYVDNGDNLEFTVYVDEDLFEAYRIILKCGERFFVNGALTKNVVVDNMPNLTEINPFDYIDVTYKGYSPNNGTLETEYHGMFDLGPGYTYFKFSKRKNLSNGETVTISLPWETAESFKEQGYLCRSIEKNYTVSGLPDSLTDTADLYNNESAFASYLEDSRQCVVDLVTDRFDYTFSVEPEFVGSVFIDNTDEDVYFTDRKTFMYAIYKFEVTQKPEKAIYVPVKYSNIVVGTEGEFSYEEREITDNSLGVLGSLFLRFGRYALEEVVTGLSKNYEEGFHEYLDGLDMYIE